MSFQVGIGSLGGTVFFQVGLCTPLRTMSIKMSWYSVSSFFLFRTNCKKGYLNENDLLNCYGHFFESGIFDHSYVQSTFSTITGHIDNSILKDTRS